ncbi:alpha/beta hydrolase family protein [Mangrovicoccus algicola]|uniref:Dienelactone hydrolase domain-containing protein n=1 Tax=Mangrovicoccus algicola TaxID=2771008 RepID=A0A8J7CIE2_9RHOB|nr:hypothetical protein [Mangrovicoccus algicola]MBE3639450.1 hypothetical protein [Mangrovicoccus algicola]
MRAAVILMLLALGALPGRATETAPPGLARIDLAAAEGRALRIALWHPAGPGGEEVTAGGTALFRAEPARRGAPLPAGPLPLVLVSHGGLRSAAGSGSWLAAALAREGFLAAEINAPRPDPAAAVDEIWRRSADISRALDAILAHPDWTGRIDEGRIAVLGVALGGTAALMTGGAALDVEAYLQHCAEDPARDADCAWLAAAGVAPQDADAAALAASRHDPRLAAALAVAPEHGHLLDLPQEAGPAPRILSSWASARDAFPACTPEGPALLGAQAELCGSSPEAREAAQRRMLADVLAALVPAEEG